MRVSSTVFLLSCAAVLVQAANSTSHKSKTCSAHGHHKSGRNGKHGKGHKGGKSSSRPVTASKPGNATVSSSSSSTVGNSTNAKPLAHASNLIQVVDKACGATGATLASTASAGPNGAASWLTCGISQSNPGSGWTPPVIKMNQLIVKDLASFQDSTFANCKDFVPLFEKHAAANGLPAIFLASFAMQESSCNPNASGDAGDAFGLMQITSDKCGGAPGGNCNDPDYNIGTGAAYFKGQLDAFGGDVLKAIGQYNGWTPGLTYSAATAAANTGCCECQNNLAYLHQFLNGWAQGINNLPAPAGMNNLAVCS